MDLLKYSHVSSLLHHMQCWHKLYWAYRPNSIRATGVSPIVALINFVIKFKGNRAKPLGLNRVNLWLYIRSHYCSKIYVRTTQSSLGFVPDRYQRWPWIKKHNVTLYKRSVKHTDENDILLSSETNNCLPFLTGRKTLNFINLCLLENTFNIFYLCSPFLRCNSC